MQSKEEREMRLYGAIDLHSNNNVTVLIDEQDRVIYQKRLPNDLPTIVQQLSGYQAVLEGIVVESTFNWYWLVDGLMDNGHKGSSRQYRGHPAIRGTEVHRRQLGCPLAGPYPTVGSFTPGLYLSETRARGA
jgi:hypothetical protein